MNILLDTNFGPLKVPKVINRLIIKSKYQKKDIKIMRIFVH